MKDNIVRMQTFYNQDESFLLLLRSPDNYFTFVTFIFYMQSIAKESVVIMEDTADFSSFLRNKFYKRRQSFN
jgi:hypothetical protein